MLCVFLNKGEPMRRKPKCTCHAVIWTVWIRRLHDETAGSVETLYLR